MTNSEFSDMFSTLLNSHANTVQFGNGSSQADIVLDEYEKSVLLTQAQDIIVKSYFDKTLNSQTQGFDDSARRQVDFSSLIKVEDINLVSGSQRTTYSSASAEWDSDKEGNGSLGTITVTNKTSGALRVIIEVTNDHQTGADGIDTVLSSNILTIYMNPLELYNSDATLSDYPNLINAAAGDFINVTIDSPDEDENMAPDSYYTLFDKTIPGAVTTTSSYKAFDERGVIFKMPSETIGTETISKVLFILNEKLLIDGESYVIVPINYNEYDREMSQAYGQPLKRQAWRLFQNAATGFDIYSELITHVNLSDKLNDATYRVRYVRRPRPIILSNLDGLTIDGRGTETACELNPSIHMDILQKAVEIAIATRSGRVANNNNQS